MNFPIWCRFYTTVTFVYKVKNIRESQIGVYWCCWHGGQLWLCWNFQVKKGKNWIDLVILVTLKSMVFLKLHIIKCSKYGIQSPYSNFMKKYNFTSIKNLQFLVHKIEIWTLHTVLIRNEEISLPSLQNMIVLGRPRPFSTFSDYLSSVDDLHHWFTSKVLSLLILVIVGWLNLFISGRSSQV